MKHTLRLGLLAVIIFSAINSIAQVTQLSNNTNIQEGIGLATVGVMYDNNGALWKTDGTQPGTSIYTNKVVLDPNQNVLPSAFNNKVYFAGVTAANGSELWVTDGTDAGTSMVADINSGTASSSPSDFILFNNVIYFFATTATAGRELWKSDGTTTTMVKDINPGIGDSYTDNTTFFINNNILFFTADDGTHGTELWKTDGTTTTMVKDINPGSASGAPQNFAALGTSIFFSANDGTNGRELWKSDGSTASLVKDILSGADSSSPSDFLLFNNKLFFTTVSNPLFPVPLQLWSTDGSTGGTSLVYDFSSSFSVPVLSFSVIIGNKFLFDVVNELLGDTEIWSSDGTTTSLFKDFDPGGNDEAFVWPDVYGAVVSGSTNWHSRLFNGKIFLSANDGTHGDELWITDGSSGNTTMVKDINPGTDSSLSSFGFGFYTTTGMYFPANDGTHGLELWQTDGTGANTSMVKDINPNGDSFSGFIMFFNGHIYFTADDGDNGNGDLDLYVVDQAVTLPVTLLNFTASLNGKAAQLQWTTSTEINTKNFVVQRSIDGAHFQSIGTVNAVGNSTQKTNYQFSDAGAINAGANTLYYRLQMVDKDGKFSYSKIATITIVNGKLFVIYPNPVKDQLLITSNASLNNSQIRITDQSGKVVYQQQISNVQAGTPNKINVSSLNKGVFYLQLITGSDVQTVKFMKY